MRSKAQNMARIRRKLECHTGEALKEKSLDTGLKMARSCDAIMEMVGVAMDREYASGLKDRGNVGGGA